ncbi:MAG: DUF2723 domain-containing protein [bacterium]
MALFVLLSSFFVYLFTLTPSVGLYDAGDMTTAAAILGIPHPPGYPFYCIIGKFITIIPFGNIAFRINMLSALFGSLSVMMVYFITLKVSSRATERQVIPSIVSSLTIAFSYTVWQQSTFAGQYIGHLTFSLFLILLILKGEKKKYLYLFSFFLGLSLTHHRQTLFLIPGALFFILAVSWKNRKKFKTKKLKTQNSKLKTTTQNSKLLTFSKMALLFILPLFLYLYLPIRASANPPLNWGDPDTLKRFISHITGEQYGFLFLKISLKEHILRMISQIAHQFTNQFTLLPVILSILGMFLMLIFDFFFFLLFFSILSVNIFISSSYNHPSIELYYMLPCAILSIFMGYAIFHIMAFLKKINPYLSFAAFLFLFLPNFLFLKNYNLNNRTMYYFTYDYGMNILRPIEKNSVVFVSDDTHTFPTEYLYWVENAREDISLVDTHLLEFEWKANLIKYQFPKLSFDLWPSALRKEIVSYDEVSWERQKDMIEKNIEKKPFYIFPSPFTAQFYEFLPEGIFSRILKKDISKERLLELLNKTRFNFKIRKEGLADSSSSVDMINCAVSHYNRGRLYYNIGMYGESLAEANKAIKIYPGKYEQAEELKERLVKIQGF